jgi:hypothetical protein
MVVNLQRVSVYIKKAVVIFSLFFIVGVIKAQAQLPRDPSAPDVPTLPSSTQLSPGQMVLLTNPSV